MRNYRANNIGIVSAGCLDRRITCWFHPPVRLSTVGSRVFTVAGRRVWNTLQEETSLISTITDDFLSTSEKLAFHAVNLILALASDPASLSDYATNSTVGYCLALSSANKASIDWLIDWVAVFDHHFTSSFQPQKPYIVRNVSPRLHFCAVMQDR